MQADGDFLLIGRHFNRHRPHSGQIQRELTGVAGLKVNRMELDAFNDGLPNQTVSFRRYRFDSWLNRRRDDFEPGGVRSLRAKVTLNCR